MKKIFSWGLMLAATFTLTNCAKEIDQPIQDIPEAEGIPFEIVASPSADTKTSNDGMSTKWVSGDAINVFHTEAGSDEYGTNDEFTITSENLSTNKFTGTLTQGLESGGSYDWYFVYPYKSAYKTPATTNSGVVYLGSKYNDTQTQEGNDNMDHISGPNFPLYGKIKALPASEKPSVSMSNLTSVIEIIVTNNTSEALTVSNVAFTAPEDIIGGYYISIVGDEPVYTGNGEYVNNTATLEVDGASALAIGKSAKFYLGIKPFDAEEGDVLKLSVNGYEKEVTLPAAKSFEAGKIKKLSFDFDKIASQPVPFEEKFSNTQGLFAVKDVSLGSFTGDVWSTSSQYIKASAYKSERYVTESWLVSPYLDLTSVSSAYLSFEHVCRYFADVETMKSQATVKISKQGGEWENLEVEYPTNEDWTFVHSGHISLASYVGNIVQVAFVYMSSEESAGTWEIKNFKVDIKKDRLMKFSENTASVELGKTFTEPTLSGFTEGVTYSSSNQDVATVAADGSVTILKTGQTVITASAAETDEYNADEASYTLIITSGYFYAFPEKVFAANETKDLGDLSWTLAGDGGYWGWDSNNGKGQQLGSSKKPYKTMTLSTSDFTDKVGSITLNTSGASGIEATLKVTVGGTVYGEEVTLTSTATEYTFEAPQSGAVSGEIVFTWTQTSSKALYLKSISIINAN